MNQVLNQYWSYRFSTSSPLDAIQLKVSSKREHVRCDSLDILELCAYENKWKKLAEMLTVGMLAKENGMNK